MLRRFQHRNALAAQRADAGIGDGEIHLQKEERQPEQGEIDNA
ncbi:MAG: hypothetical protein RQ936_07630 [Gammaproteobacteria bacterium]|nr:hypothetical protein [Gammaproteobacteria bacterium]